MADDHLMLLHGALGTGAQYDTLVPLLADHVTIHRCDLEGHGSAPLKDRPFRQDHFAENVLKYLDDNQIEKAHIFGHSLGGQVGLYLARCHADRVASVFTLGVKFKWTPEVAEKENRMLIPEKMMEKVPRFAEALRQRHHAAGWEALLEKIREMHTFLGTYPPMPEADAGSISTRVRIAVGDRDRMVSLEETIEVYRMLQNAELQIFPGIDHPLEKVPEAPLANSILEFIT